MVPSSFALSSRRCACDAVADCRSSHSCNQPKILYSVACPIPGSNSPRNQDTLSSRSALSFGSILPRLSRACIVLDGLKWTFVLSGTCTRVAADPCPRLPRCECTEPAQLDPMPNCKGVSHPVRTVRPGSYGTFQLLRWRLMILAL